MKTKYAELNQGKDALANASGRCKAMWCTGISVLINVLSAATPLPPADVLDLERNLRTWIGSLETCCASYQLVTNNFNPREDMRPVIKGNYEYCYERGDFFLVMPWDNLETGEPGTVKAVWKDSDYSYRFDTASDAESGVRGQVVTGLGAWQYPPFVYSMPHEWFGFDVTGRNRLLEALDAGNIYGFEHDDRNVLSCWIEQSARFTPFDVYFDQAGAVVQIDMVARLAVGSLEQLREFWSEDPLDFGLVTQRFEFFNPVELGGIWFPLYVRESLYRLKNKAFQDVMAQYDNGELTDNEYRLQAAHAWSKFDVYLTREVEVNPETLMVNEPVPEEAFELPVESGTFVGTGDNPVLQQMPIWYDWVRNPWFWSVLALLFVALVGVLFWKWRSAKEQSSSAL